MEGPKKQSLLPSGTRIDNPGTLNTINHPEAAFLRLSGFPGKIMVTSLGETADLEKAFNAGAMDYVTKPLNNVELLVRIRSALKLKYEMDRSKQREKNLLAVTEQLKEAVEKLNKLSSLDGLTGIPNRRLFDETIQREWSRCQRNDKPLSLIFMDIDYFKAYNDTYGHQAGDDCLKAVAGILQEFLRRGGDMIFRYGGEEFVAILSETTRENALKLAETICSEVEGAKLPHSRSGVSPHVTVSLGVATAVPEAGLSFDELIAAADKSLYAAKEAGRNRLCSFTI